MSDRAEGLRNTCWLCLRTAATAVADIVSARLAVKGLGVEGYGVFSSVWGVASMLMFLDGTLNVTARRFLASRLAVGRGEFLSAFRSLAAMTIAMAALMAAAGMAGGAWFVRTRLSLPPDAACTALRVFRLCVAAMALRMLVTPLSAALVASERMGELASLAVLESVVALFAAAAAVHPCFSSPTPYAAFVLAGAAVVLAAYVVRCRAVLGVPEVKFAFDMRAVREEASFFAWMSSAAFANALKYHGVCTLLGVYAGSVYSAAWNVSMKTGFAIYSVAGCVHQAFFPRAVKLWERGEKGRFAGVFSFSFWSSLGIAAFFASPLLFAPEAVAHALAGAQPPPETAAFLRCVAVHFVIDAAKGPVHNAVLAVGRVALYQSVDSIIMASGFIFAWGFLAAGFPAWTSVASVAATNALSFIFRFAYMAIAVDLFQKRMKQ